MTGGSGSIHCASVLWSKIGPGTDLLSITWSSTMLLASEEMKTRLCTGLVASSISFIVLEQNIARP